jgi:hypothetical protein
MNRRLLILPGTVALASAIVLGACSSTTPGASGGVPSIVLPTVPPISLPSIVLPTIPPITLPSFSIPPITIPSLGPGESFSIPSFAIPSFNSNADPELAAKFPTTIDGQPVTNVQTFRFIEVLTAFGTDQTVVAQFTAFANQAGIDPNSITFGTASATVGGSSATIQAIRSPGGDANRFIQALAAVAQATGSPIVLSPANVGGKSVQVANPGDSADYYYPNGDTAWFLSGMDPTTAGTILAALP